MTGIRIRDTDENGKPVSINGLLCVYRNGEPLQVSLPEGQNRSWITIFTTRQKLDEQMRVIKVPIYEVKVITDEQEFMASVRENGVGVMYDPHIFDGNTRWKEIR